jgi:hypothetical protein
MIVKIHHPDGDTKETLQQLLAAQRRPLWTFTPAEKEWIRLESMLKKKAWKIAKKWGAAKETIITILKENKSKK